MMVTGAKGLAAEYPSNPKPIYHSPYTKYRAMGYRPSKPTNQLEQIMTEVVQTNYTINGKTCFVIESYGEALDEFVYDSEQDAIDAAELLQIS